MLNESRADVSHSLLFANELTAWCQVLTSQRETTLYCISEQEYVVAILNLCQGQYRNAFSGLRLVVELCLQGVYLSSNLLLIDEWFRRDLDTHWASIVDEENGVFSSRFCRAFFPEVEGHTKSFLSIAKTVYRELSECIHGNVSSHIPLPTAIAYDKESAKVWHEKAETVQLIVNFALAMRYLKNLNGEQQSKLESQLLDTIGHIKPIREIYGGA